MPAPDDGPIVDHAQELLDAIRDQAAAELAELEPTVETDTEASDES